MIPTDAAVIRMPATVRAVDFPMALSSVGVIAANVAMRNRTCNTRTVVCRTGLGPEGSGSCEGASAR
ncbi:MAG: hypothetical protein QOG34_744 [Frankiaceae bacterium]|nr:hypothetical protein [Frankiaceae bacterium]